MILINYVVIILKYTKHNIFYETAQSIKAVHNFENHLNGFTKTFSQKFIFVDYDNHCFWNVQHHFIHCQAWQPLQGNTERNIAATNDLNKIIVDVLKKILRCWHCSFLSADPRYSSFIQRLVNAVN